MASASATIDVVLSAESLRELQNLVSRVETVVEKLEEIEKRIGGSK